MSVAVLNFGGSNRLRLNNFLVKSRRYDDIEIETISYDRTLRVALTNRDGYVFEHISHETTENAYGYTRLLCGLFRERKILFRRF